MSIAGKINLLIAAVAVLAGAIITLFVGLRDFSYQRDALILEASSLVGAQPRLQFTYYYRDPVEVKRALDTMLELSPAVRRVVLFDSQGNAFGDASRPWTLPGPAPAFSTLRSRSSPVENTLHESPARGVPEELQMLARLTLGETSLALTIPVFSMVNPAQRDLSRDDFARALAHPELVSSRYVIGYVNANLSSTVLWSMTLPSIAVSAGIGLIIVFLFWLIARISTRRITAPLGMLAKVADDIAAGKQSEPLRIEGSGEVRHIASVFNGIISGLHEHRQQMATDRKILNLKVDERTEQLTQHKEELDKAVQKVNETQSRIRHLSYFDTLTSLPNRRLFTEQLTLLLRLAHRNKQKVGLLVIDIDYFKRINDSLGAAGGDQLLREVSERMAGCVRDSDVLHRHANQESSVMDLSRMGGDEFTVVLNQVVDVKAAMGVAGRLAAAIARPYHIENQEVVISSSIGVAIAPEHGKDVESLLRAADLAMITAKKRGRNRILSFEPNMQGDDRERLRMENDLRKAEQRQQLLLHYQPQVHARSGEVRGVETLVRWSHPDKGLIPPFKWIPMAEELGLIDEIGNWVLRESCRTLRELQEEGFALPKMSVNVSALQFHDRFVHSVESALHESGIDAGCLSLEFTEGVMINDEETTVGLVQQLKDLGVRLSIDDFGTGYSSLSYLARFPLDEIKIDRSFVLGLARGQQNAELVRAIIAMARNLELEIVVEGVERLEELRFFREQEAHVIQGFLFSPPVSLDALRKQLAPSHFEKQLRLLDQQMSIDSMGLEKA